MGWGNCRDVAIARYVLRVVLRVQDFAIERLIAEPEILLSQWRFSQGISGAMRRMDRSVRTSTTSN